MNKNKDFLFNLEETLNGEVENELEEAIVKETPLSPEELYEEYYHKNMNLFETNQHSDEEEIEEVLSKSSQIKSDVFDEIPPILKLSNNEKKLYMQDYDKEDSRSHLSANKSVLVQTHHKEEQPSPVKVSFGKTLREARVVQNISYENVHEKTRIRIQFLKDLEEEIFDQLPASAYLKAYLKQICEIYKLPFDEVYEKYLEASNQKKGNRTPAITQRSKNSYFNNQQMLFPRYFRKIVFLLAVVFLIIVVTFFFRDEEKLVPVSLSIFVERYSLPEHIFSVPLKK